MEVFNQVEGVPIVKYYADEDVPNIEDLAPSDDSGLEASGDEGTEDHPARPENLQVRAQWRGLFTDDVSFGILDVTLSFDVDVGESFSLLTMSF